MCRRDTALHCSYYWVIGSPGFPLALSSSHLSNLFSRARARDSRHLHLTIWQKRADRTRFKILILSFLCDLRGELMMKDFSIEVTEGSFLPIASIKATSVALIPCKYVFYSCETLSGLR